MNGASATRRIARFGLIHALVSMAAGVGIANAQTSAPLEAPAMLNAIDFNLSAKPTWELPSRWTQAG